MNNKIYYIVGVIILIIIASIVFWPQTAVMPEVPGTDVTDGQLANEMEWMLYENATYGFSLKYPKTFAVNDAYRYTSLGPGKDISGVSFTIPSSYATGTNLSTDTKISVEVMPANVGCAAASFLSFAEDKSTIEKGGIQFSVASSADAGAGNYYDETVYAAGANGKCYGLRLFVHSTNIGAYPEGTVTEFDRQAIDVIFDTMVSSFAVAK